MCNDDDPLSVILRCEVRERWLSITHQILFTLTLYLQCCLEFLNKRVDFVVFVDVDVFVVVVFAVVAFIVLR